MGVDAAIQPADDAEQTRQRLREACGGDPPEIVLDATGSSRSMSRALHYAAPTGRVVYVGITTDEIAFSHPVMHKPELTLLASRNAPPGDFGRILRLIEGGRIDTGPWITHRTAFEEMIEAFPEYTEPETGLVKAVVEVQD
jgi:alcohol dehydrogenase